MDLIYMGSRKRQDLLSKFGAWGPWERVEAGSGEAGRGAEKNVEVNKNQLKKVSLAIKFLTLKFLKVELCFILEYKHKLLGTKNERL